MASKAKTDSSENVKVYVRYRPLRDSELREGNSAPVPKPVQVRREGPRDKQRKAFTFDKVFDPYAKQVDVYEAVVHPLIKDVMQGYTCTVITYGQSGTGKTFTMQGKINEKAVGSWKDDSQEGLIPRAIHQLCDEMRKQGLQYAFNVSFLKLFNEELIGLLGPKYCFDSGEMHLDEDPTRKGSVIIRGLKEEFVNSKYKMYSMLRSGVGASLISNTRHSHTIFSISVLIDEKIHGEDLLKIGKFNFVDLAGSENVGRSGAFDVRAGTAENVNQGISTLARVITSLAEGAPDVPYSESKLTRLLQDSLGGSTKTSIIATVSLASIHEEETLRTMDYARRAKHITNWPEVNHKMTNEERMKEYMKARKEVDERCQRKLDEYNARAAQEKREAEKYTYKYVHSENLKLIDEIKAMEEELKKLKELLAKQQEELRETKQRLQKSQCELTETRKMVGLQKKHKESAPDLHRTLRGASSEMEKKSSGLQNDCPIDFGELDESLSANEDTRETRDSLCLDRAIDWTRTLTQGVHDTSEDAEQRLVGCLQTDPPTGRTPEDSDVEDSSTAESRSNSPSSISSSDEVLDSAESECEENESASTTETPRR